MDNSLRGSFEEAMEATCLEPFPERVSVAEHIVDDTRAWIPATPADAEDADKRLRGVDVTDGNREPLTCQLATPSGTGNDCEGENQTYVATRMRFVVAAVLALFGFINQVQYVSYATIVRETEVKYGVTAFEVNILSLLIPVVYCLGVVPSCWLYSTIGLRNGQIAGSAANAFASLLKFISVFAPKYPLLVVAQVLVAVGQILYLSLPTFIAARWFPATERTVATAVCSLMGFAGMAVSMFASPRVVHLPDHAGNREWGGLMGAQCAISILVLVLILLVVPERPEHVPSPTAHKEECMESIWRTLRHPFASANMMLLTISFGLPVGFLTAVAAVLTQILEPFGISEKHAGILAFAGILGGAANCFVVGGIVGRLRRYKIPLLLLLASVAALQISVTVAMKTLRDDGAFAVVANIIVPLLEFLLLPLVPVTMEFSVELSFPDAEIVSTTVVLLSMCFFSFVGMVVFTLVLGDHPQKNDSFIVMMIVLAVCVFSAVGLCFVKEELRRCNQEHPIQSVAHESAPPLSEPADV